MNILPIILIDGITFASWLFLVSAGITFIFDRNDEGQGHLPIMHLPSPCGGGQGGG